MENGADKWNQVMVAAMAVPGIKVNRASFFLTSSLRHPKILIKEFSYFLMPCHQHGLRINLLV